MRIVIATGIYPPQIGGPAQYAWGLAEALRLQEHTVPVLAFGELLTIPTGIRHIVFFCKLLPHLWRADACIALDTFSVALPAVLACAVMRVPLVIRTGGDFLWESYIDRTNDPLPLTSFYESHKPFTLREKVVFAITRFVVRHSHVIFSTEYQQAVWTRVYGIKEQTHLVANAIGERLESLKPEQKNFLWYVRPVAVKNPERTREAFANAKQQYPGIVLEEGRVSHDELLRRIQSCYAVILPSVAEISPNYILDALRCGKPFIMTKESGYAEWLKPYGRLVDPRDVGDITNAFTELASPEGYVRACEKVAHFHEERSYQTVAGEFIKLIHTL